MPGVATPVATREPLSVGIIPRFHRVGDWLGGALVVVLFCLPLFIGLGNDDFQNDEAGHAFSVDVMLKDGDWLTPKSSPDEKLPFLEKPPLKFWIVAAPIRLGLLRNDEFGQRFWDALFGSVAFVYVFLLGRLLGGPVCGGVAVLLLFVHRPLLFDHGLRGNNMESVLLLAYCAGVYHFLLWRRGAPVRAARHLVAITLYFAAAFMCKFVAAAFLPAVLLAAAILRRSDRARLLQHWRVLVGCAVLAVGLVAPWFVYQYLKVGAELWQTIFGAHVYARFASHLDPAHVQPWSWYFVTLSRELRGSGALLITLVGGFVLLAQVVRGHCDNGMPIVLWFVLPVGLISLGSSKLYHYAYAFLPAVALAGGYGAALALAGLRRFAALRLAGAERAARAAARRAVRPAGLRAALLAIGAAGAVVALATYWAGGHLDVRLAGHSILRNSSVPRAAVVAVVCLALSGRLVMAVRAVLPLALLLVLPVTACRSSYERIGTGHHPVRALRDCLSPIAASHATDDPRGPGVYVEHPTVTHTFHYYLRGLGAWFARDVFSDATLYTALYVPGTMRPALLSAARYAEFTRLVERGDQELLERAARKAGMTVETLRLAAGKVRVESVTFPGTVLVLPGPYSACGAAGGWPPR